MAPTFVLFPVPEDRIKDVANFLYGPSKAMPKAIPEFRVPMSVEQRDELLTRIYVESEPSFRRLLVLLAQRPKPAERLVFADASAAMGWSNPRSLPGALGAFGRRTNHRYGGFWPFDRIEIADTWYFAMDEEVAAVVRTLHARLRLPTDW